MALFRTLEPAGEPVTLAEAKAHLKIDHPDDDAEIAALIRAARRHLEADAGVALIEQGWRLTLDDWPDDDVATIRLHPLIGVAGVTVFGADGAGALLDASAWTLDRVSRPARIAFLSPGPALRRFNGVEIDLVAGFGPTGTDVPDTLKRAILLLLAHFYEFRAEFSAMDQPVSIPAGYDRLVAPWRARRL